MRTFGYLISCMSVVLLGVVSWESASSNPRLLTCLIAGMTLSVFGMLLRWHSHRRDHQRRSASESRESSRLHAGEGAQRFDAS